MYSLVDLDGLNLCYVNIDFCKGYLNTVGLYKDSFT